MTESSAAINATSQSSNIQSQSTQDASNQDSSTQSAMLLQIEQALELLLENNLSEDDSLVADQQQQAGQSNIDPSQIDTGSPTDSQSDIDSAQTDMIDSTQLDNSNQLETKSVSA
ncbi:MAG TPA: hypothetical protein VLG76_02105 [Rhabdochlamydiaceae bacterium]|nr:hypothetical protein [Rhabdochlamydiaceae bacterium]